MPAAPTLSTSEAVGSTGHVADHNVVHAVIDSIYLATIGGTHAGALTLVQADSGEFIPINVASSVAVTVGTMAVGTSVDLYWMGVGGFTLTANGVTFEPPTPPTPRARYSTISLLWRTATIVVVGGDIT